MNFELNKLKVSFDCFYLGLAYKLFLKSKDITFNDSFHKGLIGQIDILRGLGIFDLQFVLLFFMLWRHVCVLLSFFFVFGRFHKLLIMPIKLNGIYEYISLQK